MLNPVKKFKRIPIGIGITDIVNSTMGVCGLCQLGLNAPMHSETPIGQGNIRFECTRLDPKNGPIRGFILNRGHGTFVGYVIKQRI